MDLGTRDLFTAGIGDEIPPLEVTITEEMVWRHCFANDDYNPWYMTGSPFGARIAPSTIIAPLEAEVTWDYYALPQGGTMNARQESEFINPLIIGKKIKVHGWLVDRYVKRERTHFVFEYLTVDEDGRKILHTRKTRVNPVVAAKREPREEEHRMSGTRADPTAFTPMKISANSSIEVGFELEPVVKNVTLDKTRLYHGWPRARNQHTDYEVAHKNGLRQPIIQGNQVWEQIGELLIKFFGQGFYGGSLSARVIHRMEPDTIITSKGIVREKRSEENGIRLVLDVWSENERGEKVIVGTASGLVPTPL